MRFWGICGFGEGKFLSYVYFDIFWDNFHGNLFEETRFGDIVLCKCLLYFGLVRLVMASKLAPVNKINTLKYFSKRKKTEKEEERNSQGDQ